MIQVYSLEADLKSPERKLYYRELVSFVREWLHNIPGGGTRAFKQLFFEGTLDEPRGSTMRVSEPFLICLASPSIDRSWIVDIFNSYPSAYAFDAVEIFRSHFHGRKRPEWPEAVRRYWLIVEALGEERCAWLQDCYDSRYLYLGFYVTTIGALSHGESSALFLGACLADYVESNMEELFQIPEGMKKMVYFREQLEVLLAGNAENPQVVYNDSFLLSLLQRFFSGGLSPYYQALVTEIYEGLEQRITWVNGQVRY